VAQPIKSAGSRRALLVSFSGVDGAGKSTQIDNLRRGAEDAGYRVRVLAFWDDVVVGCRFRESFVHKAYKSERGVGAPGKPVARRDKNVRRWYLTLLRHALYLLDALSLAAVARARSFNESKEGRELIIFDRYIYDELANLPLRNPLTRSYLKLIELMVPRPDVAYLLDADPEAARSRKPEYPVAFLSRSRIAYKDLALLLRCMTFVPALPLAQVKVRVEHAFWLAAGAPAVAAGPLPEAAPSTGSAPAA